MNQHDEKYAETKRGPLRQLRWWRPGGFRLRWLSRLTNGRLGMGRWTQAEVDAIRVRAKARVEQLRRLAE